MLLHRSQVRRVALAYAKKARPGWNPTRISGAFYNQLDAKLIELIKGSIDRHPSRGQTIREVR